MVMMNQIPKKLKILYKRYISKYSKPTEKKRQQTQNHYLSRFRWSHIWDHCFRRNLKGNIGGSPTKIQRCWQNQENSSQIFARWIWIIVNEVLRIYFWLSYKNYGDNQLDEKKWRSPYIYSNYQENINISRSKIWLCCCVY